MPASLSPAGERVLNASLVFVSRFRANNSASVNLYGNDTFVDSSVCLTTSYGDRLASSYSACKRTNGLSPNNTGILGGIGGIVALDDAGESLDG